MKFSTQLLVPAVIIGGLLWWTSSTAETQTDQSTTAMTPTYQPDAPIPSEAELRERLTPLQYAVAREDGTEPAFRNEYWDNKEPGIYVDIISGEPLFASIHKYKSGTGWPSFWQPISQEEIVKVEDNKLWMSRTEVRSKTGDTHLGHVFPDGPQPTGLRYCINSASLSFVPVDQLEEKGYGQYKSLFDEGESVAKK